MRALEPRVLNAVWEAVHTRLPVRPADTHPLGCHKPRRNDRDCFEAIVHRLVTGCSWDVAGRLGKGSASTLRARRDEWHDAGVFDAVVNEALAGYDRIIGLQLADTAIDGSSHKAPCGGEGTGPNPTDRAKTGWKWSVLTERFGIPIGWATAGANRHDSKLFAATLQAAAERGLLGDVGTLNLDKGYDSDPVRARCAEWDLPTVLIAKKNPPRPAKNAKPAGTKSSRSRRRTPTKPAPKPAAPTAATTGHTLGRRWPVERTNSWLSNYGQLRRNTDRRITHRLAQFALAVAFILTIKLFAWADRWNR